MFTAPDYNRGVSKLKQPYSPSLFRNALKAALNGPLPGEPAQQKMAPPNRVTHPGRGEYTRTSAVLVLLYPTPEGIMIPFTLRLHTLVHHAGEISFPGGGREAGDATLEHTALRETSEELGLNPDLVDILGALTRLYVSASRNIVYPVIGWADARPPFKPSPLEVERIIEVRLKALLNPQNIGTYQRVRSGKIDSAPCYRINTECIWGATAMILSELLAVIPEAVCAPANLLD